MNFDTTLRATAHNGNQVEYGIIRGNNKIVFIKSGAGGDYRGYDDKYLKMARRINMRSGFTVITSSNPGTKDLTYEIDKFVLDKYVSDNGLKDVEFYLIGSSNGAYQNIFLIKKLPLVKKILCINMPLMMNFQKATKELEGTPFIEKIFVCGSDDPSIPYLPLLEAKKIPNLTTVTVNGADHNFYGMNDEFILLSDMI